MENYTHLWISSPNSKSAARNANRFAERTVWQLIAALRLCKRLDQLVAASLRARAVEHRVHNFGAIVSRIDMQTEGRFSPWVSTG
jgi:hypothetical protein